MTQDAFERIGRVKRKGLLYAYDAPILNKNCNLTLMVRGVDCMEIIEESS